MSSSARFAEEQLHRQIDARITASAAIKDAKPVDRPSPWRSERWGCLGCGVGRPIGGFTATDDLDAIIATTVRRDEGIVWVVHPTAGIALFCDVNCERVYKIEVERGIAQPVQRMKVDVGAVPAAKPPTTWAETMYAPERKADFRCGHCPATPNVKQIRRADGSWLPTIEELEATIRKLSWVNVGGVWYCGPGCLSLAQAAARGRSGGLPPTGKLGGEQAALKTMRDALAAGHVGEPSKAVEHIDDATYQQRRVPAGANALLTRPDMVGREVGPSGRRAPKVKGA